MSLSKRLLDEQNERAAKAQASCRDCFYDWNDKFWNYCDAHAEEERERAAREEASR